MSSQQFVWFVGLTTNPKPRHISVDLSMPSILPPQVWVPSTPSTLVSIYIWFVSCRKDENKPKKWPRLAHLKKEIRIMILPAPWSWPDERSVLRPIQTGQRLTTWCSKIAGHAAKRSVWPHWAIFVTNFWTKIAKILGDIYGML